MTLLSDGKTFQDFLTFFVTNCFGLLLYFHQYDKIIDPSIFEQEIRRNHTKQNSGTMKNFMDLFSRPFFPCPWRVTRLISACLYGLPLSAPKTRDREAGALYCNSHTKKKKKEKESLPAEYLLIKLLRSNLGLNVLWDDYRSKNQTENQSNKKPKTQKVHLIDLKSGQERLSSKNVDSGISTGFICKSQHFTPPFTCD